ncbi:MAG: choice-of-anchor D domain-containing protein [Myxococcota bacterium]
MRTSRLLVASVTLALAGCRCEPPNTGGARPDFDPNPKAMSFEACPVQDEGGNPVQDVFPDEKKLLLKNLGKAPGEVHITFAGPEMDAFSLVEGQTPQTVDATSEVEFPVRFTPTKRGDSKAEMTIDDGDETTDLVTVALVGTGRNLPAQPTLEVSLQDKDLPDTYSTCFTGGTCLQVFPDTFYGESSTLLIKLENTGCPALKISALELERINAGGGTNLAYFLDEPAVPPTSATPLLLTTADGRAESVLKIRFAPENDGSGITQRYALLKVRTNDPANPEFLIQLGGSAAEPSVYSQPTFCDFTQPLDLCGNPTKQPNQARFEIKNGGNADISIDSVAFGNPGQTRFTITQNVQGQTIVPGGSAFLLVSHNDAPLYTTELLTVTASSAGRPAGKAVLSLAGGLKPCLSTDPAEQLDFQNATTELTRKQVQIKNGQGCGTLMVNRVFVDPNPFFSVVEPLIPAGTQVAANTAVIATVQYKKPVSGGTQTGVLRIDTNDPDYGPTPYKVVRLYSDSPLDQLPVAVVEGCYPTDVSCSQPERGTMSVRLSSLVAAKELIISGMNSYDPPGTTMPTGSQYQFRLVKKPTNAANASLEQDGVKQANDKVKLILDPLVTGLYQVTLTVYDNVGQPSPPADLKVLVSL